MTVFREVVSEGDLARLATLHVQTLPRSLVSLLGKSYARAFYRFVARSRHELLCVSRDADGTVVAAAVLSLMPATLQRRLALHTSLLLWAALRPWRLPVVRLLREAIADEGDQHDDGRPELIIIFADPLHQGEGLGSKLIAVCEQALVEGGCRSYTTKTEADPDNRALGFYLRNGFAAVQRLEKGGLVFQAFQKILS